jgi:hypothetical protein
MAYFVSMTDKFMSGWGEAEGRTSKYVVECDTTAQANQILHAAHKREEMKYINTSFKRPRYPADRYQVTRRHWNDLGGVWKEGFQD